ncbi:MAG TPA: hypothetical protein VNK92_05685 [Vicinamibacterales bacterium]|nr:hypothetical protein [Vicinamibacterales bacterium]
MLKPSGDIEVDGCAVVNGSPEPAVRSDLTERFAVRFGNTKYDASTHTVSLGVTLTNTSESVVSGPLKLRVLSLRSSSGVPVILDSDNGVHGPGAVWDFSAQLPHGRLDPGQHSGAKQLRFRLDQLAPFRLDSLVPTPWFSSGGTPSAATHRMN